MRVSLRGRTTGWLMAGLALAAASAAEAAPWRTVAQGLALFDTQIGLQKNYIGDGWDLSLNSAWNNKRIDFGLADLTLNGAVTREFHYTRRILPSLDFSWRTPVTPLAYTFNINDGVQDLIATGQVSIRNSGTINCLGFYDLEINVSNRGRYSTEGYALEDSGTTDFDIGPINVTGNIFVDMIAAVTEPLFSATGQPNPFAKVSGRAAKEAVQGTVEDAIRSKVAAGKLLTQSEIESLIGMTMTASLFGEAPLNSPEVDSFLKEFKAADTAAAQGLFSVPEPVTILFLGLALAGFVRRPRVR